MKNAFGARIDIPLRTAKLKGKTNGWIGRILGATTDLWGLPDRDRSRRADGHRRQFNPHALFDISDIHSCLLLSSGLGATILGDFSFGAPGSRLASLSFHWSA